MFPDYLRNFEYHMLNMSAVIIFMSFVVKHKNTGKALIKHPMKKKAGKSTREEVAHQGHYRS
jgi:hypothetical protein